MPPEPQTSLAELLAVIGEQVVRIRQLEQYAAELERQLAEFQTPDPELPTPPDK
jgi:hypothetical protein